MLYDPTNALARGLMGLVAYHGKWERPEQVSQEVQDDPERKARIKEYLERRAKAPDRAEDQWKLALWCEQNDLKQQATAHLFRVLQLDPSRDAAWKHLGYKRIGGRWDKPERVAAAKAEAHQQHKADKHWKPILEKLASRTRQQRQGPAGPGREKPGGRDRSPGRSHDLGRLRQWRRAASDDRGETARPDRFTGFVAGPRASGPQEPIGRGQAQCHPDAQAA